MIAWGQRSRKRRVSFSEWATIRELECPIRPVASPLNAEQRSNEVPLLCLPTEPATSAPISCRIGERALTRSGRAPLRDRAAKNVWEGGPGRNLIDEPEN